MSTINLNTPEVSVREIRLGSITGFHGNASELVDCAHCGKLKDKKRSFSQCLGCSTSNAACMTILVQDGATISHGPVGCSTCLHDFAFTYRVNAPLRGVDNPTQRKIYSTNLTEKDTIYGGAVKLENTIREVYKRAKPNVIFVLTTCAAGIIGDDVESVTNSLEDELGIPIVAIFCEGFRSKMWTSGFDASFHGIARKLIKPAEKKTNKINVINFWGSDIFNKWFNRFGYEANYITPYSTLETLRHSSESACTVQACATLGSYLATALDQEFGVPELKTSPPYGIAQTERWFRELGGLIGKEKEVEEFLAEEKEKYMPKIEELRKKLAGKTAYVTAGASHGHSLLAMLSELGMKAVGAAIFHHDPIYDSADETADTLKHTVEDYGDVPNFTVCNKQEFELVNVLNRLRPDILFARHGGMTLWGAKFGIPSLLIGDEHYGMGYEGLVKYGEQILETIENSEFVKNLEKHAVNPYTKWWLEQEPYTFLKGGRN
ncbi:MAG: nitrogenase [Oscillospiraceae bacterium]|nr:nitrogenase [Oscillospiraceae bacterium]